MCACFQRAQEKLAQAQQFYMTAQIMRQADNSGGLLHAPLSVGLLQNPGQAPASPSKPLSGPLHTDGSEATQWTSRTQENSLSAVAQSYMSTQNTSGATTGALSTPDVSQLCACHGCFTAGSTEEGSRHRTSSSVVFCPVLCDQVCLNARCDQDGNQAAQNSSFVHP